MDRDDTLSGGQFFAALRLVRYAGQGQGRGKWVDRALVFVQRALPPFCSNLSLTLYSPFGPC